MKFFVKIFIPFVEVLIIFKMKQMMLIIRNTTTELIAEHVRLLYTLSPLRRSGSFNLHLIILFVLSSLDCIGHKMHVFLCLCV